MIKYPCPHCNEEVPLDAKPKFKNWKERFYYIKKRFKARSRHKVYFVCPNCKGELLQDHSRVIKFNKDFYDSVNCGFCGKGIKFSNSYKELDGTGLDYTFWCAECLKKEKIRRLFLVFIVIIFIILIVVGGNIVK